MNVSLIPPHATRLRNVRLFDGERELPERDISFDETGIIAVGDTARSTGAGAGAAQTIDAEGAWLIPGLMDCHIHLELNPDDQQPPAPDAPRDPVAMAERARQMVHAGITTARDLGGGAWAELAIRDRINAGELTGPRLLCAGQPVTSVQGHCHFWGGEAATFADALAVFERQREHGVDLLKIMATGGRFTPNSSPHKAQFDLPFITDLVAAARAAGMTSAAHCHGTEGIHHAAHAGITTIEHCSWVGEDGRWASAYDADVVAEMARQGTWVSPTIGAGWARYLTGADGKPSKMVGAFRACYDDMRAQGVRLIASTDAGIPGVYHHHLPQALDVFRQIAGLSGAETLRCATANAADALGIGEVTGRIRQGLSADLLLLDGDPTQDLTLLQTPLAIWARGNAIKALA